MPKTAAYFNIYYFYKPHCCCTILELSKPRLKWYMRMKQSSDLEPCLLAVIHALSPQSLLFKALSKLFASIDLFCVGSLIGKIVQICDLFTALLRCKQINGCLGCIMSCNEAGATLLPSFLKRDIRKSSAHEHSVCAEAEEGSTRISLCFSPGSASR